MLHFPRSGNEEMQVTFAAASLNTRWRVRHSDSQIGLLSITEPVLIVQNKTTYSERGKWRIGVDKK